MEKSTNECMRHGPASDEDEIKQATQIPQILQQLIVLSCVDLFRVGSSKVYVHIGGFMTWLVIIYPLLVILRILSFKELLFVLICIV